MTLACDEPSVRYAHARQHHRQAHVLQISIGIQIGERDVRKAGGRGGTGATGNAEVVDDMSS